MHFFKHVNVCSNVVKSQPVCDWIEIASNFFLNLVKVVVLVGLNARGRHICDDLTSVLVRKIGRRKHPVFKVGYLIFSVVS